MTETAMKFTEVRALNLESIKDTILSFNNAVHRQYAERLIEEIERLKRGDFTDEEFNAITDKYGVLQPPSGMQFVAVKIPEGYELACREMRLPNLNDYWLASDGSVELYDNQCIPFSPHAKRVIVKKIWIWPEWLTANWIALSPMNNWWGYNERPIQNETGWECREGSYVNLNSRFVKFDPPQITKWQDSLMQNPHRQDK